MSTTDTVLTLGAVAAAGVAIYELVGIGRGVASGVGQTLGDIGSGVARTPGNAQRSVSWGVNRALSGIGNWPAHLGPSTARFARGAATNPAGAIGDAISSVSGNPFPLIQRFANAGTPKRVPSFALRNPEAPNLTAQRYRSMSHPAPAPGNPTPPPPKSIKKTHPLAYSKLLAGRIR